jgi:hypothetical protein
LLAPVTIAVLILMNPMLWNHNLKATLN